MDDEPGMRFMLAQVLQTLGHEPLVFGDAESAWESFRREPCSLAILDWKMPGMDGLELCRRIRASDRGDETVVVVVTASDSLEDLQTILAAGADDYVAKPAQLRNLKVRLAIAEQKTRELAERKRAEKQLARARRREREVAARIQASLLVDEPPSGLTGVRVGARTIPSGEVDGDFFDFFKYGPNCFDVLVGDVLGKGVPAALMGAAVKRMFLRAMAGLFASSEVWGTPEPEDIVRAAHRDMTPKLIELGGSMTACYARFDQVERRVRFVDCGHTKTAHYRHETGECEFMWGENVPLGFLENEVYTQKCVSFGLGDVFVFYSDGLTEARDASGEFFGEDRLAALISRHHELAPEDLIDRIVREVAGFSAGEGLLDDLTCVAALIAGGEGWAPIARAELDIPSRMEQIRPVRTFVRRFCEGAREVGVDEAVAAALELAVDEALTNILRHAYKGRPEETIRIEAEAFADRVCFRLYDSGEAFRPSRVPPPTFEESRSGRYGLYIIDQCVDEVKYYRTEDDRNCTSLMIGLGE